MERTRPIFWVALGLAVFAFVATKLDKLKALILDGEGERLTAYPDSGGVWTIGVGHKILATDRVVRNGALVQLYPYGTTKTITPEESAAFFERDTATARNAVSLSASVPLSDNQFAALSSLAFNIGSGAFKSSTLLKKLNARDYAGAADQFGAWVYDDGVIVPRLVSRRAKEKAVFLS